MPLVSLILGPERVLILDLIGINHFVLNLVQLHLIPSLESWFVPLIALKVAVDVLVILFILTVKIQWVLAEVLLVLHVYKF